MHPDTKNGEGVIYMTDDGSDPISSQNRRELKPGDTLTITGTRKIKLVVADQQGKYGVVQAFDVIDELNKYKIARSSQLSISDETISFVFPVSRDSAKVTLSSLLSELAKSDFYSKDDLHLDIDQALKGLKN